MHLNPDLPPILRQTSAARVSVDVSTTSTTFVSLLSLSITVEAGFLLLLFTASVEQSNDNQTTYFDLQVNGTTVAGASHTHRNPTKAGCVAISHRMAIAAGTHTVSVGWRVSNNTSYIRPVTDPTGEHGHLLVQEVTR